MKVEQVLGEEPGVAASTDQPLGLVLLHVRLQRRLLVELFPTVFTLELLLPGVNEGVSLEAGSVGKRLGTLLADVGA